MTKKVKIGQAQNTGQDEWRCHWYECPECGEISIARRFEFCPECGVELVWEEE